MTFIIAGISLICGVITYGIMLANLDYEADYNRSIDWFILIISTLMGFMGVGLLMSIEERHYNQLRWFQWRRLNHKEITRQKSYARAHEKFFRLLSPAEHEDLFVVDIDKFRSVLQEYAILERLKK